MNTSVMIAGSVLSYVRVLRRIPSKYVLSARVTFDAS
jgi:hypothetical protein